MTESLLRAMRRIAVFVCAFVLIAGCQERVSFKHGGIELSYDCDAITPQARTAEQRAALLEWANTIAKRAYEDGRDADAEKADQMIGMEDDFEREVVRQACELEHPQRRTALFPDSGTTAPPLRLPIVGNPQESARFDLHAVADRHVLVEFWSLGCPPCLKRQPNMASLARELAGERIVIIGVSPDPPASVQNWLQEHGGSHYLQLHDIGDGTALAGWGVYAIPRFFLLAPGGKVVASCYECSKGAFAVDSLQGFIRRAMAEGGSQ